MDVHPHGAGNVDEFHQANARCSPGPVSSFLPDGGFWNISGNGSVFILKVEGRADPCSLSAQILPPIKLYKPSAYGEAQARAAVFSGGGGVNLAEGLEEFYPYPLERCLSLYRKWQSGSRPAPLRLHTNRHMASFCKF